MSFEDLAGRVPGVLALRTVKDGETVVEVHVLVGPTAASEDIARSIRSVALLSDVELAPEQLHIVQLEQDVELAPAATPGEDGDGDDVAEAAAPAAEDGDASTAPAVPPAVDIDLVDPAPAMVEAPFRTRLTSVSVRVTDGVGRAEVEISYGIRRERCGVDFVPTTPTERRAVAEATVRALTSVVGWKGSLGVDTAVVIQMPTVEVALVTLAWVAGEERTLVGAAPVQDGGVHDAIARAALDATNRAVARQGSSTGR